MRTYGASWAGPSHTDNITTFPKGTTIDKTYLQPGELIHTDFEFYNVNSIRGFTSMLNVVCEKTRTIRVFPTASKISPVQIIRVILTGLKNKKHQ